MARSRGRRTSASSGCDAYGNHSSAGCQPRRDRPAGVRHLPRVWAWAPSPSTPTRTPPRRTSPRPTPGCGCRKTNDYLNAEAIIAAARAAGADAVHPGYGFLSENADFAAAVQAAGLVWIGPPVDAVRAMGSKIESKKMMAAAGVPVLDELDPDTVTADQLPVLVKASAGGGGRGMRVVDELDSAARRSRRGSARGPVRVRRPDGVLRALPAHRPPRRGSGDGRLPRHGVGGRRAGMLDPAPPPEDHRGGAVTVGRAHTGHAGQAVRRRPAGRRARSATPAPGRWSSSPTTTASSTSWR